MRWQGGKCRLAKRIVATINELKKTNQTFVEPFCGGCNITWLVEGEKIVNDICPYIIAMWKALQQGWEPPFTTITREHYNEIRKNYANYPPELVGYVVYGNAYGANWTGGFGEGKGRNALLETYTAIKKQIKNLEDTKFFNKCYLELEIPNNSFIYCDPPYLNTKKYKNKFDHERFYQWCRGKAKDGHTLLISELSMPTDFKCIKSFELMINVDCMNRSSDRVRIENLYTLNY